MKTPKRKSRKEKSDLPIKSLTHSDPSKLKIGDRVWVGDLEKTNFFKDKCSTCFVELNGVEKVEGLMITEESMCWGHETYELLHRIGAEKSLRIEQWRNPKDNGAWRAGIEWYGEDDYEFICEYPTLVECLRKIEKHLTKSN